jgi:hypothetical protein
MTMGYVEPKEEEIIPEQRAWLQNFYNRFNTALNSAGFQDPETGYAAYIDVDEWIDHHLLNVLAKNVDALRLSTYMYIPREGKLAMGPIWDFDRSMDSYDGRDDDPRTWNGTGDATRFFDYPWWRRLFQDPGFWDRYIARWQELRQGPLSTGNIHATIDAMRDELVEAQARNFERWPEVAPQRVADWQGEIDWLKDWLEERAEWMDSQFPALPQATPPSGIVEPETEVQLAETNGVVYYTTDGSDPRMPDGSISPSAISFGMEDEYRYLISADSFWRYWDKGYAPPSEWTSLEYNHLEWSLGQGDLGYGDNQNTQISYGPDPNNKYPTAYFRRLENILLEGDWAYTLRLRRDDGAVVYWNGRELVRDSMPDGEITFNTYASGIAAGADETTFFEFPIPSDQVLYGPNAISVEVHQANAGSSDLSFNAELIASREAGSGGGAGLIRITEPVLVRARTRLDNHWSGLSEFVYVLDDDPELAITELMVNPPPAPGSGFNNDDFEFIEIQNLGDRAVFMTGMTLETAVWFTFPNWTLEPGEIVLIVKNLDAFEYRYGDEFNDRIAGVYSGNLANEGEILILKDVAGNVLSAFGFFIGPGWPSPAAGGGSSLQVLDPDGNFSAPSNWYASAEWGGTPGAMPEIQQSVPILSFFSDATGIAIEFEGESGRAYSVWATEDLQAGDWSLIERVEPLQDSGPVRVYDSSADSYIMRFYAVTTP